MSDRGTYEDLKAQVGALANSVNKYRLEIADLDMRLKADGVAIAQLIARVDRLEDTP